MVLKPALDWTFISGSKIPHIVLCGTRTQSWVKTLQETLPSSLEHYTHSVPLSFSMWGLGSGNRVSTIFYERERREICFKEEHGEKGIDREATRRWSVDCGNWKDVGNSDKNRVLI